MQGQLHILSSLVNYGDKFQKQMRFSIDNTRQDTYSSKYHHLIHVKYTAY